MNSHDLLDLLLMYQGSIGTRVFSEGNQDYLEVLIAASQRLGRALAEAPLVPFLPRAKVVAIVELLEREQPGNAQLLSHSVLGMIAELRDRLASVRRVEDLYVKGPLPALSPEYDHIVIYFGAAMGLGDQITFYQTFRHLLPHCGKARMTLYTLYPGVWAHLLQGAEERTYRDDPTRPFFEMNAPAVHARELIISADFEVFDLHRNVIEHRPGRDILEVSLGRMTAWLSSSGSPWIRIEEFRSIGEHNYAFSLALAQRLIPRLTGWTAWEPIEADAPPLARPSRLRSLVDRWMPRRQVPAAAPRGRAGNGPGQRRRVVFVNPFTSKDLPFTALGWAWGVQEIYARLKGRVALDVVIYPGIEPGTRAFAAELCERLRATGNGLQARLLDADSEALTAHTALPAVVRAAPGFDICVTVDTFSAHLVPLFRVPTVVMAYAKFRRFWVPSRYTYNCLIEDMQTRGVDLIANLILLISGESPEIVPLREGAGRLLQATRQAHLGGVTARSAGDIEAALAQAFQQIPRSFPSYAEAQHWLMIWSRLTWALGRQTVEPHTLRGYLDLWEGTDVYKLLTLESRAREARR
jgi:hypothetical protein